MVIALASAVVLNSVLLRCACVLVCCVSAYRLMRGRRSVLGSYRAIVGVSRGYLSFWYGSV